MALLLQLDGKPILNSNQQQNLQRQEQDVKLHQHQQQAQVGMEQQQQQPELNTNQDQQQDQLVNLLEQDQQQDQEQIINQLQQLELKTRHEQEEQSEQQDHDKQHKLEVEQPKEQQKQEEEEQQKQEDKQQQNQEQQQQKQEEEQQKQDEKVEVYDIREALYLRYGGQAVGNGYRFLVFYHLLPFYLMSNVIIGCNYQNNPAKWGRLNPDESYYCFYYQLMNDCDFLTFVPSLRKNLEKEVFMKDLEKTDDLLKRVFDHIYLYVLLGKRLMAFDETSFKFEVEEAIQSSFKLQFDSLRR